MAVKPQAAAGGWLIPFTACGGRDEDVNCALLLEEDLKRIAVAHVARCETEPVLLRYTCSFVWGARYRQHLCALFAESDGRCKTDARSATKNHGGLANQPARCGRGACWRGFLCTGGRQTNAERKRCVDAARHHSLRHEAQHKYNIAIRLIFGFSVGKARKLAVFRYRNPIR